MPVAVTICALAEALAEANAADAAAQVTSSMPILPLTEQETLAELFPSYVLSLAVMLAVTFLGGMSAALVAVPSTEEFVASVPERTKPVTETGFFVPTFFLPN